MKPAPEFLQQNLDIHQKLIVDLFAGGGGFSEGIYMASGRNPDIAINHNPDALSMHRVNHPDTRHFIADVFEVDPRAVTQGRAIGHLHASPDCTHHSQAAGGQPRNEKRRALAWVVVRWAGQVSPEVITLENVVQMLQWGRLIAKRDKATGRVVKLDGSIADSGERVPREFQYLIPDPKHKGDTWRRFVSILEGMGYTVAIETNKACSHGAGTTRERLYMIARRDGLPVEFPEPTYFKNPKKGQKKWSAASEHIDWSIPGKSIFDRKKPLAEATMRRIAKGIKRFVLDSDKPFIIQTTNTKANGSCVFDIDEPLRTNTTRREFALASPVMVQAGHGDGQPGKAQRWGSGSKSVEDPVGAITASNGQALAMASLIQMGYGERKGQPPRVLDLNEPLGTVVAGGGKHAITSAYLMQANGGFYDGAGRDARDPMSTITNTGSQQQLVAAHLTAMAQNVVGHDLEEPMPTALAGATRFGVVEAHLSKEDEDRALRVSAFLMSYYGTDNMSGLDDPAPTITTKDRLALVTVYYQGEPYVIVDITLRMLEPHELYSAQGFPKSYIITHGHDGRKFSKSKQVMMCGNSVSPLVAAALFRACHKHDDLLIRRAA